MALSPESTLEPSVNEFDQLKGTFLSSLNHEIRTPLSGILGMADLLLETNLDDEQREYVAAARLCAESLFQILNATLEYSALEAGATTLDESEFCVRDLLESIVEQHRERADSKGLLLKYNCAPDMPETMIGDAQRIRDILNHLLDNSLKFSSEGEVELSVSAQISANGATELTAAVRDTGPGIPQYRHGVIFESFRQGEGGLARAYSGLGLGLALVRKLLSLMGGNIELQSEVGQGSTFTVHLPLKLPGEAHRDPAAAPAHLGGPLILAVDDNAVGMLVIRHALKGRDVRLELASDGFEAVEAARNKHYDLILMDLQMPRMDGLEATKAIRQLPGYADVPILALTADFSDELRRECLRHGMQGFLSKPVESGMLWAAVSRHLPVQN